MTGTSDIFEAGIPPADALAASSWQLNGQELLFEWQLTDLSADRVGWANIRLRRRRR